MSDTLHEIEEPLSLKYLFPPVLSVAEEDEDGDEWADGWDEYAAFRESLPEAPEHVVNPPAEPLVDRPWLGWWVLVAILVVLAVLGRLPQ